MSVKIGVTITQKLPAINVFLFFKLYLQSGWKECQNKVLCGVYNEGSSWKLNNFWFHWLILSDFSCSCGHLMVPLWVRRQLHQARCASGCHISVEGVSPTHLQGQLQPLLQALRVQGGCSSIRFTLLHRTEGAPPAELLSSSTIGM